MSSIELKQTIIARQPPTHPRLQVKRIEFESRKATFIVESESEVWFCSHVSFHVGPIGLRLQAEEAEALGHALIECAKYYQSEAAKAVRS